MERAPLLEGKSMHITVASTHKPKVVEHAAKHGEDGVAAADGAPVPVPTDGPPRRLRSLPRRRPR